jgi:hypothetical protein
MLVKVGRFYLTLGTFALFTRDNGFYDLILAGNLPINLDRTEGLELERILDEAIAAQQTIKQQVEAVNKQQAELQAKAQEIAQYEQQLMQKAAQVDAAYTAMQQNKSPVILPPGFGRKHRG